MTATTTPLDLRGWRITTYVVFEVAAELAELEVGDRLELITDDFEPFENDTAAWCQAVGHELVASETTTEGRRFLIESPLPTRADEPHWCRIGVDTVIG